MTDLEEALAEIVSILDDASLPYMLTGGLQSPPGASRDLPK